MNATIQKWGNSLAIRIPMSFAKNIHLHQGSTVNLVLTKDTIEIHPKKAAKKYVLSEMLKKVNKNNIHPEVDWGPPVGREILWCKNLIVPTRAILCGLIFLRKSDMSRQGKDPL